jgi:hypothetical protein
VIHDLDKQIQIWLAALASEWGCSIDEVPIYLPVDEIEDRLTNYPVICSILSPATLEFDEFSKVARKCWALGGRFDLIRFGEFIGKGQLAADAIKELIRNFPSDDEQTIRRIDTFVEQAVKLGYSTPKGSPDRAGAALLASVLLTSLYPKRFADFRQSRWIKFAGKFNYQSTPSGAMNYGEKLIWTGRFVSDFSKTMTFQRYWPQGEPSWVIAGICWYGPEPPKPQVEFASGEEIRSFPEGAEKRRLHLIRERNRIVVSMAKELAVKSDPSLKCEVCGFSYVEKYGEHGRAFIEAHHRQPIASLKPGSQTRVEDISLICANCHRMVHRGDRTLTIEELRIKLKG